MACICGWSRNSKKLYSSGPIEHFARDIGAVKLQPYNVEAKAISFVKQFSMDISVNIKKRGTRIAIILFLQF